MHTMYSENIVKIAKRENNSKRKYLVINKLQGKHIPVKPHEALDMFKSLAAPLKETYQDERLLIIGFAETATAIGAAVAIELGADYMQTTRESIPGVAYLYFSEEHSHATEQKLVKNDIDSVINTIDRIVFIEDEVTTGKTILNIIHLLGKQYSGRIRFSVASILNGMDEGALNAYADKNIELFWLVKTDHSAYTGLAESYKGDGKYILCSGQEKTPDAIGNAQGCKQKSIQKGRYKCAASAMDTRRLTPSEEYADSCERLYHEIIRNVDFSNMKKILVLGTEEFMYPPLYIARRLEQQGKDVRFHATTRSPIAVSTEDGYPLRTRYELRSFYDAKRTTYIYDLDKYDCVLAITDAKQDISEGRDSLEKALMLCGNENILLFFQ